MNEKQIEIITSLLIDNELLYVEAKDSPIMWDHEYCLRVISIKDYCYQLYIDTLNNNVDVEFALNRITHLLNKIAKYREDYEDFDTNTCGYQMYCTMNSFFDKTFETFEDFLNTL